jgi:hypothetical protein
MVEVEVHGVEIHARRVGSTASDLASDRWQHGLLPPPPLAPPVAWPGAPPLSSSSPLREAEEQDGRRGWPPASLHDGGPLLGDLDGGPFPASPLFFR